MSKLLKVQHQNQNSIVYFISSIIRLYLQKPCDNKQHINCIRNQQDNTKHAGVVLV